MKRRLIDAAYIAQERRQVGRATVRPRNKVVMDNLPRETGWKPYR
jgi:hypothetical protein